MVVFIVVWLLGTIVVQWKSYDIARTGEATTSEERQTSFEDMMRIALEAVRLIDPPTTLA